LLRGARGIEQRFRLSWWDSLIVSAAQAQQCGLLLSKDLRHGSVVDGVCVQNPFVSGVSDGPPAPIRRKPRPSRMQL
jgi:predicted nucleic acid-binding protein